MSEHNAELTCGHSDRSAFLTFAFSLLYPRHITIEQIFAQGKSEFLQITFLAGSHNTGELKEFSTSSLFLF
jgi:hypothetical protein